MFRAYSSQVKPISSINRLVSEFSKLPGIGRKTALRLAFHIVDISNEEALSLSSAIEEVKNTAKYCNRCFNLTDSDLCDICVNHNRDNKKICVVESARELLAIEKTSAYNGLYHVLHGAISPLDNIGPSDIKLKELISRINAEGTEEVVVATNSTVEGEATAMYISRILENTPNLDVTRIAQGVPIGGDLEYADEVTLARALEGRRSILRR